MIVSLAYLMPLVTVASAYKYLPDSLSNYRTSEIPLHKYTAIISNVPHHVLIKYSSLYCSGSLVRSRIVLTAASCFEKRTSDAHVIVKVGSTLVTEMGQVIEVLDVKTHEYFGYNTNRNNDIAILVLKEHVIFGKNVQKILVVESGIVLRTGIYLQVSSWGGSNLDSKFLNFLLQSDMVVMDRAECKKTYPTLITSSNFCVRYQSERRLSDNGGAAEYEKLLVGIVSFGATKTQEPYVAVLTNVSYFNRWITLNANRFLKKYCVPPHLILNSQYDDSSTFD